MVQRQAEGFGLLLICLRLRLAVKRNVIAKDKRPQPSILSSRINRANRHNSFWLSFVNRRCSLITSFVPSSETLSSFWGYVSAKSQHVLHCAWGIPGTWQAVSRFVARFGCSLTATGLVASLTFGSAVETQRDTHDDHHSGFPQLGNRLRIA